MTSPAKFPDTLLSAIGLHFSQLIEFYQDPFHIKKPGRSGMHIALTEIKVYVPSCFNIKIKTT